MYSSCKDTMDQKSVLLIVDENWSTGSIAKDLKILSKDWRVDILHWGKYPDDFSNLLKQYDAVVSFTLIAPVTWPILKDYGVICCGPVDFDLILSQGKPLINKCVGAVSTQTFFKLIQKEKIPSLWFTPATARLGRFERKIVDEMNILGWCGDPNSACHFNGQDLKQFNLFKEIVNKSHLLSKVSYKDYNYDNIQSFYHSIDILICTSVSEGGPLPVFEAIACGIPVISTDVGLTKEIESIKKFESSEQATEIIEQLKCPVFRRNYIEKQYIEVDNDWSMEKLLPLWETFFGVCSKLN